MEITTLDDGRPYVFALEGRLDASTAPRLDLFAKNLHSKGIDDLVVDMSGCDHVSSAGLRVIVAMQKRAMAGGSLVFRAVSPEVMEVFVASGFDRLLTFA